MRSAAFHCGSDDSARGLGGGSTHHVGARKPRFQNTNTNTNTNAAKFLQESLPRTSCSAPAFFDVVCLQRSVLLHVADAKRF